MVAERTRKKKSGKKSQQDINEQSDHDVPSASLVKDEFFNRELSWLAFNRRVLSVAADERYPLLERCRFLSIFMSNLDEFFMNRVGGLKQRLVAGIVTPSLDGRSPKEQLDLIRIAVGNLLKTYAECFKSSIKPALEKQGITVVRWPDLSATEQDIARQFFKLNVFPILTPQAVDTGHPFPFVSNLSVSLAVMLRYPDRDEQLFARVKVPGMLPQLIRLDPEREDEIRLVSLTNLVEHNLQELFPGMIILNVVPFRVTRHAELEIDDYEGDDLVQLIEQGLKERRFAQTVRLEHESISDPATLRFLCEELSLSPEDVYEYPVDFDYLSLKEIVDLNLPKLKFEPWIAGVPPALIDEEANIFATLRAQDIILHHPYESFSGSVERFLRSAVEDPKVISIKMTLYRAGDASTLVPLLIRASELEKQVVCLIEVKAHFDEARNIRLAQRLEDAGVHVMYGVVGLKTHAKILLVARQEPEGIRCYAHIGTGNYNSVSARTYTDLGLLTANSELCDDLVHLFHYLTGRSLKRDYQKLLIAPHNMREQFLKMIEREGVNAQAGHPAHIVAKCNGLQDVGIMRALEKASKVGVKVDLLIRGMCCLKPQVQGVTENIRIMSTVGRFLEHSRIYYFRNAAADAIDGTFYISSADWMYRNLHRRVEVAVPILEKSHRDRLWEILDLGMRATSETWDLDNLGTYKLRSNPEGVEVGSPQIALMKGAKERARTSTETRSEEIKGDS